MSTIAIKQVLSTELFATDQGNQSERNGPFGQSVRQRQSQVLLVALFVLPFVASCNTVGPFKWSGPQSVSWSDYGACLFTPPTSAPGISLPSDILPEMTSMMSAVAFKYQVPKPGTRCLLAETVVTSYHKPLPAAVRFLLLTSSTTLSAEVTLRDRETGKQVARKKFTASWEYAGGVIGAFDDVGIGKDMRRNMLVIDLVGKIDKSIAKTLTIDARDRSATPGRAGMQPGPLDESKVAQLKEGVSTREDVITLFGAPEYQESSSEGTETLMYTYSGDTLGYANMQMLIVVLDSSGKLREWTVHRSGGDTAPKGDTIHGGTE